MRISQYIYFALMSTRIPAAEITARLGIEPDEVEMRGSRLAQPPRPAAHAWKVVCRDPDLTVEEQIAHIAGILYEHAERIGALVVELDRIDAETGTSRMQVLHSQILEP